MATFLVVTRYLDLEAVAEVRPRHLAWIAGLYDEGRIVVSGRKSSDDGAVIVLRADDEEAARTLLAADPYAIAGLIDVELTRFEPVR